MEEAGFLPKKNNMLVVEFVSMADEGNYALGFSETMIENREISNTPIRHFRDERTKAIKEHRV